MATPEERMLERMGPASIPRQPSETEAANIAFDKAVQKAASTPGLRDESSFGFLEEAYEHQMMTIDEVKGAAEGLGEAGKNMVLAMPSAFLGTSADLMAVAVGLGYNALNVAQGEDFAWPEDFSGVPATSDFYGEALGADVQDFAFIGGALAITNPAKYGKFVNKTLQFAKALKGGRKASVARMEKAQEMLDEGVDRNIVWKETGWFPDSAGRLRFFISDADAKLKKDNLYKLAQEQHPEAKLHDLIQVEARPDEMIDHPALFELYPTAAGNKMSIQFRVHKDGNGDYFYLPAQGVSESRGTFNPSNYRIGITHSDPIEVILHEMQHKIDTIAEIGSGSNASVLASEINNFRFATIMRNVAKDKTNLKAKNISDDQWKKILSDAGLEDEAIDDTLYHVKWVLEMEDEAADTYVGMMRAQSDRYAKQSARWLNEIEFMQGEEGIKDAMLNLSQEDIANLAWSRYITDEQEVSARITQALRYAPQEALDDLPADPLDLQQYLDKQLAGELAEEGFGVRPMAQPVPLADIVPNTTASNFTSLSESKIVDKKAKEAVNTLLDKNATGAKKELARKTLKGRAFVPITEEELFELADVLGMVD